MEGHLGQCWTSQLMLREANDVGILWVIWEYPKYARQSTLLKLISGYLRMIHDESLIYKPSFSHRTLEILQVQKFLIQASKPFDSLTVLVIMYIYIM